MNEVLRTVVASGIGALVATTALTGPPAFAGQLASAAAKQVTSAGIKDGTIKPKDLGGKVKKSLAKADTALQGIPDNSVTNPKLADGSVTNLEIVDGSVYAAELASNAVGAAELADDAVDSGAVVGESLTAGDLAPNAVGSSEVATDAVGSAEIDDGAIVSGDLATGSVTASAVSNGSLTLDDVARSTGTATVDFASIATGTCLLSGAIATGVDLNDAIIVLENDVAVTGSVQIQARQAQPGFTSFVIIACNSGGAYDPPSANIRWAVLD